MRSCNTETGSSKSASGCFKAARNRPLADNLRYHDPFLVCANYASYLDCQEQVSAAWQDRESWTKMSILTRR